jgi:flagellar motor switch protein FliM
MNVVECVLSPEEIDALLSAMQRADVGREACASDDGPSSGSASSSPLAQLSDIHESFARRFSASLTTLLGSPVEVTLKGVERAICGDFVASLAAPACLAVATMDPLDGRVAMAISPNVLFRVTERLLGGAWLLPVRLREFTEFEQFLIERVATRAMDDLQQAWGDAGTFGFRIEQVETRPDRMRLAVPSAPLVVASLEIKLGAETGSLALAFADLLLTPTRLPRHRCPVWRYLA